MSIKNCPIADCVAVCSFPDDCSAPQMTPQSQALELRAMLQKLCEAAETNLEYTRYSGVWKEARDLLSAQKDEAGPQESGKWCEFSKASAAPVAPGPTPRVDALLDALIEEGRNAFEADRPTNHQKFERAVVLSRQLERELAEARFSPLGDNHHNALACPYCNPNGRLVDSTTPRRAQGREMKLAQVIEEMKSWAEDEYATPAGGRIAKWVVAIEASPSSPIPEGMVLVPREPTEAMIDEWNYACRDRPGCAFFAPSYRAMLAASGEKGEGQ